MKESSFLVKIIEKTYKLKNETKKKGPKGSCLVDCKGSCTSLSPVALCLYRQLIGF